MAQELKDHFHRHARFNLGYMRLDLVTKLISTQHFGSRLRKISLSFGVYGEEPRAYRRHTPEETHQHHEVGLACLDGLANFPGDGIDLMIIADGATLTRSHTMRDRALATSEAFQEALDLVFPRLVALEEKGYKTSLVVDAKYHVHHARERFLKAKEFEYIFTPRNATFSLEGYMKKMHEVKLSTLL